MALLAGGLLGFASLLLQQVLNNPLASDGTLGISSGAQAALFFVAILLPNGITVGSSGVLGASVVALIGALLSLVLVVGLAWRKQFSPLLLILSGLVVNLYFGAFSSMMMLFYPEESRGLAQWGAGSLVQDNWQDVLWLSYQAVPLFAVVAWLIRPLSILSLNEENASSLGVPVMPLRLVGIVVSAYAVATVVSLVGMLGFVGLAAAVIVRQLAIRSFAGQLVGAFLLGALLLALTDTLLQLLQHWQGVYLPTGAVTAVLSSPLLLWLMFRTLKTTGRVRERTAVMPRAVSPWLLPLLLAGLAVVVLLALLIGRGATGWQSLFAMTSSELVGSLVELRLPRVFASLAVGILLAIAGVILQFLTKNPMASPELLGVSSGTAMGILAVLFVLPFAPSASLFWVAGIFGAFIALLVLLMINQRNGMLPEKVLLTGLSLSALFDTLQRLVIASGDLRVSQLVAWLSGSTQHITANSAFGLVVFSLFALGGSLLFARWLALLNLSSVIAQSLGLTLHRTRLCLILMSALFTAVATLVIGPFSFIGLLVPHLARFLGGYKPVPQLLISACLGGIIMVFADWLGRQILFPYEVPAGLMATLIGGTYVLLMVRKV